MCKIISYRPQEPEQPSSALLICLDRFCSQFSMRCPDSGPQSKKDPRQCPTNCPIGSTSWLADPLAGQSIGTKSDCMEFAGARQIEKGIPIRARMATFPSDCMSALLWIV